MTEQPSNDRTNEVKTAWSDVGDRFTSWGRQVAERYRTREPDADAATTEETTEETGRKLDAAARDLTEQLNRVFGALSDTLRDETAKSQLKDAVRALGDAVSLTVNESAEEIRRRMRSGDEATGGMGETTGGAGETTGGAGETTPSRPDRDG